MAQLIEWDSRKARRNLAKHGVSFEEAVTVFYDPLSLTIGDPLHSEDEERCIIIGMSARQRLLIVVHTDLQDTIRIVSARGAKPRERKFYEESK